MIRLTFTGGGKSPCEYSDLIFGQQYKKTIQQFDRGKPVVSQYMYITESVNTIASRRERSEEAEA